MEHLFRGKFTNYVKCIEVEDVSLRDEDFYDLQMPVKGCKDLYASFDEYVKEEVLDGDNQYQSERFGKQDAKKGVQFKVLPPVLELHLRRFEYDFATDAMAKINERFEFPTTLDMDRDERKYFTEEADPSVRNLYKLHSVLVHSGGPNGGHYYAFIRPLGVEQWYRFDDERVTKVTQKEAVEGQFGGVEHNTQPGHTPQWKFPKISNAYMLVYIRESSIPEINVELTQDDVALHVRRQLEIESEEKARKKKERQEAHLYTVVRLATHHDLTLQIGSERFFDLVTHEKCDNIRILKEKNLKFLKQEIWRLTGARPSQQRLWLWAKRQNATFRPDKPLSRLRRPRRDDGRQGGPPSARGPLPGGGRVYLEPVGCGEVGTLPLPKEGEAAPEEEGYPAIDANELLLFLKFYEPSGEKLSFVGTHVALYSHTLADLLPALCAAKGLPPNTSLAVYEEVEFETQVRFEPLRAAALRTASCRATSSASVDPPQVRHAPAGGGAVAAVDASAADVEMVPADGDARVAAARGAAARCSRWRASRCSAVLRARRTASSSTCKLPPQQSGGQSRPGCAKERALQIKRWTYTRRWSASAPTSRPTPSTCG